MRYRLGVVRGLLRLALPLGIVVSASGPALGQSAATVTVTQQECWAVLNELAAAAVFSDLTEAVMEQVYERLDALQDACDDARLDDAAREIAAIEAIVGR